MLCWLYSFIIFFLGVHLLPFVVWLVFNSWIWGIVANIFLQYFQYSHQKLDFLANSSLVFQIYDVIIFLCLCKCNVLARSWGCSKYLWGMYVESKELTKKEHHAAQMVAQIQQFSKNVYFLSSTFRERNIFVRRYCTIIKKNHALILFCPVPCPESIMKDLLKNVSKVFIISPFSFCVARYIRMIKIIKQNIEIKIIRTKEDVSTHMTFHDDDMEKMKNNEKNLEKQMFTTTHFRNKEMNTKIGRRRHGAGTDNQNAKLFLQHDVNLVDLGIHIFVNDAWFKSEFWLHFEEEQLLIVSDCLESNKEEEKEIRKETKSFERLLPPNFLMRWYRKLNGYKKEGYAPYYKMQFLLYPKKFSQILQIAFYHGVKKLCTYRGGLIEEVPLEIFQKEYSWVLNGENLTYLANLASQRLSLHQKVEDLEQTLEAFYSQGNSHEDFDVMVYSKKHNYWFPAQIAKTCTFGGKKFYYVIFEPIPGEKKIKKIELHSDNIKPMGSPLSCGQLKINDFDKNCLKDDHVVYKGHMRSLRDGIGERRKSDFDKNYVEDGHAAYKSQRNSLRDGIGERRNTLIISPKKNVDRTKIFSHSPSLGSMMGTSDAETFSDSHDFSLFDYFDDLYSDEENYEGQRIKTRKDSVGSASSSTSSILSTHSEDAKDGGTYTSFITTTQHENQIIESKSCLSLQEEMMIPPPGADVMDCTQFGYLPDDFEQKKIKKFNFLHEFFSTNANQCPSTFLV